MLSIEEVKKVKEDLESLVNRTRSLPESTEQLLEMVNGLAAHIPAYDALINDLEKGNSHDDDMELIASIQWTKDAIQKINQEIDLIAK